MSNAYYSQQPSRQPVYDNPLHNSPYQSRQQQQQQRQSQAPFPRSASQTHMLASHQDGLDYNHFHGPPASHHMQPYHDPYAAPSPARDDRPSFSHPDSMRQNSAAYFSKDMLHSNSDEDEHDRTLRGTDFPFAKDEESGRIGVGRGHQIAATDGLLPDVPPDMDRLNPEQKEIMKQFPPDLDDEDGGKSGLQAAKAMMKNWKSWFKLRYLHWWIMGIVVIAIVALTTIYHKQIVDWLTPISKKVTTVAWGWIIPVAILFVISFPPLFGHEIVLILVGLVYGIWIGFGIAALGTLLGEIGNFYAFKHCLRSMASGYERKNIHYACMAEMVRDGGFWVMFLARLSAIPGHFTTAVFATVGMNIFIFTFAAILALPKQLLIVYLGVAIKNSGNGTEDTKSKIIKYVVLVISFVITVWTAYWLYQKMEKVRPTVSARLRQKRYELLLQARTPGTEGFSGSRERMHTYPPNGGVYTGQQQGGAFDASYGYRPNGGGGGGADDSYGGYHAGDFSSDTYNDQSYSKMPASMSGRQPLVSSNLQPRMQYDPPSAAAAAAAASIGAPTRMPEQQHYTPTSQPTGSAGAAGGRQPIAAPMQFHRPIRQNSAAVGGESSSPFQDPPARNGVSNGYVQAAGRTSGAVGSAQQRGGGGGGGGDEESRPLTNATGDWASTSSLAASSPVDGAPPDYVSFAGGASSHNAPLHHTDHPRALQPNVHQSATAATAVGVEVAGAGAATGTGSRVDPGVQRYHLSD